MGLFCLDRDRCDEKYKRQDKGPLVSLVSFFIVGHIVSHPLVVFPQDLQPLSLTFDLPASLIPQTLPDADSPLIQQVAQTLGVSVSFKAIPPHPQGQPAFYESCCTVWGLQGNTAAVKVAV